MSVQIRPVGAADLPLLERIENEADTLLVDLLQPDQWHPAPTSAERLADRGIILVAEREDRTVVGFVHVIEFDGGAHLEQVSVLPAFGGQGIGRALVEAAKDAARRAGYARLTLRTFADVPWNAPFYASAGFAIEEPSDDFHRMLVETETRLGLGRFGRRVQMGVDLPR
ncbi:GNAT family N-acetyltransferase [Microbacterium sp. Clip185]|uniref:GNAT family N-acetyltransferase n=1 Tax=Microbacterium sp. Clip185 TaxID=3025663 RepID=UPI0023652587|nr:GNAT family N-acetyltransferase [Microbacterium sp. Clip185]WDG19623.1 GNAT family N-acetyltransferase [Microbacterium sp. Clip185]